MSVPRIAVTVLARELGVPVESIQWTVNKLHIKVDEAGTFQYFQDNPEWVKRFHAHLASRPLNRAEQLRADLGIKPPRVLVEE